MQIDELFGKYALGVVRAEDYIAWAEQQLTAGIESPSLPVLAGMDLVRPLDSIEVYEWFQKVTKELGIDWPDDSDALQTYSEILCRQIVDGTIPPASGLTQLARLYPASDYTEGIFALWDSLEEDICLTFSDYGAIFNTGLTRDNSDEYIRNVARQYLKLAQLNLPDDFFQLVYCQGCSSIQQTETVRIDKSSLSEKLYRLIYDDNNATWEVRCAGCGSRNLQSMNDYAGRENFLAFLQEEK